MFMWIYFFIFFGLGFLWGFLEKDKESNLFKAWSGLIIVALVIELITFGFGWTIISIIEIVFGAVIAQIIRNHKRK